MNTRKMLLLQNKGSAAAAFSPLSLSPLMWFDFSDVSKIYTTQALTTNVTSDGDAIGGVKDISGNNHHITQATAGKRPLYKVNILNGKSVCRTEIAADSFLFTADFTISQPTHVYAVVKYNGARVANDTIYDGNLSAGGFNKLRLYRSAASTMGIYAGSAGPTVTTTPQNWHIHKAVFNGASSKIGIDAGSYATGNAGTGPAVGFLLGASGNNGAEPGGIDVAEVLVFSSELSAPNETLLINYLNTRWAVF